MNSDPTQAGPEEESRPVSSPASPAHAGAQPSAPPLATGAPRPAAPQEPHPSVRAKGSKDEAEQPFWRWLLEFVLLVGAAFILATAIKTWVVQPFYIPSGSMETTLNVGDRVLVNKFVYTFTHPKYGDVVVFVSPEDKSQDLIKRVIAVGGQTVQVKDGYVYVNGKKLDEPYVQPQNRDHYNSAAPTIVPKGYVWVMGDNRANSSDSRFIGPQPVTKILGQAFVIYWPLNRIRGL